MSSEPPCQDTPDSVYIGCPSSIVRPSHEFFHSVFPLTLFVFYPFEHFFVQFPKLSGKEINTSAMDHPNDNTSSRSVAVRYMGMCGKPTPDGLAYPFEYSEQAPLSLCSRPASSDPAPDPDATGQFVTFVIDRHNDEMLRSRAWLCQVCENPAKELFHSAIPRLSPGEGASAEFKPFIWDTVVPICRSGGDCDRKAEEMALEFGKEGIPTLNKGKCCQLCGKVTGVKVCSGCKVLRSVLAAV
jgi:hypothetical protein